MKLIGSHMLRLDSPAVLLVLLLAAGWVVYSVINKIKLERQRSIFKAQHGCKPPTSEVKTWDYTGLIALYRFINVVRKHKLLDFWEEQFEERGTTYVNYRSGNGLIVTRDVENIKAVLSTRFDDWANEPMRLPAFGALLGRGIFTTDGAFWAHSRAMLRPQFEKSQVADLDQFESHIGPLLAHIPKDGSTVDLQDLFHNYTMDASTEFLMGTSTDCLKGGQNNKALEFAEKYEEAVDDAMSRARLRRLYYLFPHRKENEAIAYCHKAVDAWVKDALEYKRAVAAGDKPDRAGYVFLRELATDERVDVHRIRDESLNILLAGRDTTASLLSDLWFCLARNPEVFSRLQAEVDELQGKLPTYERLRDMKYIKYCAQETLRLYPPVPALGKVAVRDTLVPHGGGPEGLDPLFVAKGSLVFYNFRAMMRMKSAFGDDALEFRPERWADPNLRPGWSYLPFGGGPRVCLGQQYALTEAYYVTIRLMQHFRRLEKRDDKPWTEKMTVTCCSFNGTKVGLYE